MKNQNLRWGGHQAVGAPYVAQTVIPHLLAVCMVFCTSCVYVDGPREATRTVTIALQVRNPAGYRLQVRYPNGSKDYPFGCGGRVTVLVPGMRTGRTVLLGLTINRYSQASDVWLSLLQGGTCVRRISWGDFDRTSRNPEGQYTICPW
jgi:hypothetical protein